MLGNMHKIERDLRNLIKSWHENNQFKEGEEYKKKLWDEEMEIGRMEIIRGILEFFRRK
jgi:hypothetical protein